MVNPFNRDKLIVKASSFKKFDKIEGKPSILRTFEHLCPSNKIKHSSRALMSLCPLHGENNPSFAMYEETNTYYCFSCQVTGDSYTLIMELEDLNFKEALEYAKDHDLYD